MTHRVMDQTTIDGRKRQREFVKSFKAGATHDELAEEYGVSRHTIANWLKAAGVDPALNVKRRRARREDDLLGKLRQVREQTGQRELAMTQLLALSERLNVKPLTLAHYAERTGHYRPGKPHIKLSKGRPRRLPRRLSTQGAALAREVEAACNPWTPRHIAGLLRERTRTFT